MNLTPMMMICLIKWRNSKKTWEHKPEETAIAETKWTNLISNAVFSQDYRVWKDKEFRGDAVAQLVKKKWTILYQTSAEILHYELHLTCTHYKYNVRWLQTFFHYNISVVFTIFYNIYNIYNIYNEGGSKEELSNHLDNIWPSHKDGHCWTMSIGHWWTLTLDIHGQFHWPWNSTVFYE